MAVCTPLPAVGSQGQITCKKCTVTHSESGRTGKKHCSSAGCSGQTCSIQSKSKRGVDSKRTYRQFEQSEFCKSVIIKGKRVSGHNAHVKSDTAESLRSGSLYSHSYSDWSSSFSSNVYPLCVTVKPVKISSSNSCSRVADKFLYLISLFITLLIFSQLTMFVSAAPCTGCPPECDCNLDADSNCIINCSDRFLTVNPIKSGLDPNTTHILLRNNQISEFGEISLYTKLVVLDMAYNLISAVPENLFTEMSSLTKLDLSNNEISSLKSSQLEGLTELKQLYLHHNQLTQPILQVLPKVENITLSGNKWVCSCHLEWLQTLLNSSDIVHGVISCSAPPSLEGQSVKDVDLRSVKCALSYVSCLPSSTEKKYIVWEYTDWNTSAIHDKKSCNTLCLSHGYHYASVHQTICLCAEDTTSSLGSDSCTLDCNQLPLPTATCGKTVVHDAPFATGPLLIFEGVKTFSVEETVEITVIPALTDPVDYVWNFNDSTVIMTSSTTVKHKYTLPGTYIVTIGVNQFHYTYLISVAVEEPIKGVAIHCPKYVEPNEPLNITVDLRHGTKPRLKWMSKASDGEIEYDESFKPSSAEFYERTQTAYLAISSIQNWTMAFQKCAQSGGLLAVIDNQNVTDFILSRVVSSNPASLFWLGMADSGFAGTLGNAYGQVLSSALYSNWADGEPDEHISQFVTPGWCVAFDKNDSGKWKTLRCTSEHSYICQYRSPYHAEEPQNFIAGPTEFQTKGTWTNLTVISSEPTPSTGGKAYVLLFPGLWLKHGGLMKRWEFTGQSNTMLRLQLYRPTCKNSKKAIRPGCTEHSSPFLTCANASVFRKCREQVPPCTQGYQYCSITHTCKALSESCSDYSFRASNEILSRHSLDSLSYVLVSQHSVNIPEDKKNSYQVLVESDVLVRSDDVIGVAFSQASLDISDLSRLPLHCQKSNLSTWRQSALLVTSNSFAGVTEELDLTNHAWVDLIWCDIRLKFTEEMNGHRAESPFLTPKVAGNFTYSLVAFNNVSQTNAVDEPQTECVIEVRDRIVSVTIAAPLPNGETPEGYPIIYIPTGMPQAIALKIEGGGSDVIAQWTGIPSGTVETVLQARCPLSLADTTPGCSGRSDSDLRISTTNITLDTNTTMKITARNTFSSAEITIRVATGEAITGLKILPETTTRILSSIPLVFTAHVDTGTDVSYSWVIDELTQYAYLSQEYNVLFRTMAFYDLQLTATNLVGTESVTITVNVDAMNRLTDIHFVGLPDISQRNKVLLFEASFLVDENIDYKTKWLFDVQGIDGPDVHQPHSGVRPDTSIERVEQTVTENFTFTTTGEKTVKITVLNDYDTISVEKTIDIREPLESVSIALTSEKPETMESLRFECSAIPSTYATRFEIDWGDGNRRDFSEDSTSTHSYSNPGTYVINVTGDNEINSKWNTTNIIVYERITGLTVTSDGPTEINLDTIVTSGIDTGLASAVYSFDFGSPAISAVVNSSLSMASGTYRTIGRYNVTVMAANLINSQQSVIEVLVFEIQIVEVNATAQCFKLGTNATMHAYMPTDRLDLFRYIWDLGSRGTRTIDSDNRLDELLSVGIHEVEVRVESKKSAVFDEESVSICVQEEIADVTITVTSPVEVNSDSEFNLLVSGGTNNSYVVDFGDGSTPASQSMLGKITYKYSGIGNYTVVFSASNLVSEANNTVVAIVQEAVKGISVTTNSDYGTLLAKDYEVTYTAETTNGSDLNYSWDFGDGSSMKYGQNIVHNYSVVGNYTITLVISNLVSSESYMLAVAVKEPVSGAMIMASASLVRVNSTVHFTASATNGGPVFTYTWKVDPGQNFTLGTEILTYKFQQILNYTVTVKIENEVSAQYAEVFVLAAENILAIDISTENLAEGKYVAQNESTDFEVLLVSGEPISSTTAGFTGSLDFFWTITFDGVLEDTYEGSATISHTFLKMGAYTVKVNVTNGVSTREATIEVISIERITELSFEKLEGFEGASATGDTVKLQALIAKGTDASFYWNADDGSPESSVNNSLLNHVYDSVGTYYPYVTVSNVFGNTTDSYEVVVQDRIEGLEVIQVDSIVEFYVALSRQTNFKANVTKGTDVEYSWYYIDKDDGTKSKIENTTNNYIVWSFPKLTTYTLKVNASNRVHWDDVEYIVTVIRPIFKLELDTDSLSVATNSQVEFNASIASGDGVNYRFFVDNILKSGSILSELLSQLSLLLDTPGTFEITVEASNNVSMENATKTISVLDPIAGPAINGCCISEQYYAVEDNHTFIGEIQSGTNISYDWTITYENGAIESASGKKIHLVLSYIGRTEIKLSLMNEVSSKIVAIYLHLQERPKVDLSIQDPGRSLYTEENVTLEIDVERGTNVTHSVDFHDDSPLTSARNSASINHIYNEKGIYTIRVNSSNEVDSVTNTVLVQIQKLVCKAPIITFVESIQSSRFFRSSTIYVEATVLINCTAYEVDYNWSIYMQSPCTLLDPGNLVWPNQWIGINSNRPLLVLPRLTLEVNEYCFNIDVSFEDTSLSTSSSVLLEVLSTPLTVIIAGGTILFISADSSLTLDAGKSFDPDQPMDWLNGISFQWSCEAMPAKDDLEYGYIPGKTDSYACPIITNVTASKFDVPSGSLREGGEYKYTVIAMKNGKTSTSAWQKIIVVKRAIPTTTIDCYSCDISASYSISASFHVGLSGNCITCSSTDTISYLWNLTRREISSTVVTDVVITDDMTTTGITSPYLVIKEGALINSYEYEFKLKIVTGDQEGYSKLVLSPNLPPSNGTCLMSDSNSNIYVLETLVSFHCANWSDEEEQNKSPLVYTIIASSTASDEENDNAFILYRGTQNAYKAYLPLGFAPDYTVNIKILVEDQLGTSIVGLDENVSVIAPELIISTTTWLQRKMNNELEALLKMNDPQDIIDFCAAAITVLNTISFEYNYNELDADYSNLVMIREKITMTVADISTTTLKDVQQIASILKQSVLAPAELQNPSTQRAVLGTVNSVVAKMAEYVDRNGHTTFEQTSNEILDIIGGMIRAVNYVVYNEQIANQIPNKAVNVSVNYTEEYRLPMINSLLQNIDDLLLIILKSKVLGEEAVNFRSTVFSISSIRTTPRRIFRSVSIAGCTYTLPDHLFENLDQDMEIFSIAKTYEQNPFTFGYPSSNLGSNGFANITSRVLSLQFFDTDGILISVNDIADREDSNDRRIRMSMTTSSKTHLTDLELAAISAQPQAELNFTTQRLNALESMVVTLTNDNRDPTTSVYIMVTFDHLSTVSKTEPNPVVNAYFDYDPKPNIENHTTLMQLTDSVMANSSYHQAYTFYLEQDNATVSEFYLNISNFFEYHDINVNIAIYYTQCLFFNESTQKWIDNGLRTSAESSFTLSVCYSNHLTSFGSFVINPPNLITIDDITSIDFKQSRVTLIAISVVMLLYIIGLIWARRLDLRDIKNASLIPLCGPNTSHKYEITIKTGAGMGSGTSANVGICIYGYDSRSGSRHLYKKGAFERGAVDTLQIAHDISLGTIYKIKIWHDNTGLDPGWYVDRVMVKDIQTGEKYYFLVNSWLQVYPDDDDETCLEKTVRVANEEELTNFSQIFGSQLSYGWEDAHLWLSVIDRPARSRFTRVQRVTCCVTLLLIFMVFSAFWYQGYDEDGEVSSEENVIGLLRWKDIAVGAIVSLMVFPLSLVIVCVFKKSESKVTAVKPWSERVQTAKTIEILDEIIDGGGRRFQRTPAGGSIYDDNFDDDEYEMSTLRHNQLAGQSQFLDEYYNDNSDSLKESSFLSRSHTPVSRKSKSHAYETNLSNRSKLHKTSGTLKSLDINDKIWSSDESGIQMSVSSSSSGIAGSSIDVEVSSNVAEDNWPNRKMASLKGLLHFQSEVNLQSSDKKIGVDTTSVRSESGGGKRKKSPSRQELALARAGSASPPNFIPDDEDDLNDDEELWNLFNNDDSISVTQVDGDLILTNKQVNLKRTRVAKFTEEDELPVQEANRGLVLDDVITSQSDEDSDDSDVPLPDLPSSRGGRRGHNAQGSVLIGSSPQPTSESFLLPHWCIYVNYAACVAAMALCIFFIIVYGSKFGPDTSTRWLLSMLIALLESFFIIEPVKVVLFAVFLALVTKPIAPEENDNLVEEPHVENYGQMHTFNKVRAPGGFALSKCKKEAKKTQRSDKLLLNLAVYLIFLTSVAAVASWDRDTMSFYATGAVKDAMFTSNFTFPNDSDGIARENNSATFYQVATSSDIWDWLIQVFTVKIFDNDLASLDNENFNNVLLGEVRLRQQRVDLATCIIDADKPKYTDLTEPGQICKTTVQTEDMFSPSHLTANYTWNYAQGQFSVPMYWGENSVYDDSGYSQFLNASLTITEAQQQLEILQSDDWIDRMTAVVFVEFTLLNPATNWFMVTVVMFEMGLTGAVLPSYSIQTVRLFRPSSAFFVDMLFMSFVGIIGIFLLVRELKKICSPRCTASIYFYKWTNWINITVLTLTLLLCIFYMYKEIYLEDVMQKYLKDNQAFTNFYKVAFHSDLVTYTATILLAVIIVRAARLLRFIKSFSVFGMTLVASAGYLAGATLMLLLLIFTYAMLGYLVFGQSYPYIVEDFKDYPNSIYAMFRTFRGTVDVRVCYDANPAFAIFFFLTYYFGIFFIFCRIFAAIIINEYKGVQRRKRAMRFDVPDYEILNHMITRLKLRLGIIKPKQFRPNVRFEGMSTPSSRGSFMSIDSFDTCFMPGRISQCSYATGISSSSSDSGLGTPSDHSVSVFDYLTLEQPSDRPLDTLHVDYLYSRLSNYSVDMMLHRLDRVNKLGDEVLGLETDILKITERVEQRKKMKSQSKEIAAAASSMTSQPNYVPPESEDKQSTDATFSSRGHFNLQSQQNSSQISLSSGRRSSLSNDSRFQTVLNIMFPNDEKHSGMSEMSWAELGHVQRPPVRTSSYTGLSPSRRSPSNKSTRGTLSSANADLRSEGNKRTLSSQPTVRGATSAAAAKQRPHSDEGVRINAPSMVSQAKHSRRSLNDVNHKSSKQPSQRSDSPHSRQTQSESGKTSRRKPNPLAKKSAW